MVMDHEMISRRLDAFADGEVSEMERQEIERHLSVCAICAAALAEIRRVSGLFKTVGAAVIDDAMMKRLHEAVEAANIRRRVEWLAGALSAVAACVAVVIGLNLIHQSMNATTNPPTVAVAPTLPDAVDLRAIHMTSTNDDSVAVNDGNMNMAQFMVADLSEGGNTK